MRSAWRWYGVAGAAVVAGYLLVPAGPVRDLTYLAVGASSVVAMVVGIGWHRPRHRVAWAWLTAGQALWVLGDVVFTWYESVLHRAPFPSPADVCYLLAYGGFVVGLLMMLRPRRRDIGVTIDTWVVTVALGFLSWVTVVGPAADAAAGSALARAVGAAYPAGDLVLMALIVRLVYGSHSRTVAFRLIVAAVGLLAAADTAFTVLSASPRAGYLDVLWLASYVLWGVAALHPSMATPADLRAVGEPLSLLRRVGLTAAVLVAPGALAVQIVLRTSLDGWAIVVASTLLFSLVVARMQLAVRDALDSSRERDLARGALAHLAGHDPLTNLANRARMREAIDAALGRARSGGGLVGLLVLDLDDFGTVNAAHGQSTGDAVLRGVAARLTEVARPGDLVGRLGGDEFGVLVDAPDSTGELLARGERVLAAAAEPVRVDGAEVTLGASVGIAFANGGGEGVDALLYEATAAVDLAKSLGRGHVEIFDEVLRREHDERRVLEAAIRDAIEHDELVLHYQPIVRVDRPDEVVYYEALVRWDRPGHGLVRPDEFIPVAELSDLICDLDCWVLERAARELVANPVLDGASVAVNISGRHLASPSVVSDVARVLAATGLAPRRLVLEITETVLVDRLGPLAQVQALRALGVKVSIDDFGTGYTSIAELQEIQVDSLKIDRSLVAATGVGSARLVELVAHAAHAFGLSVIGEGVEDDAQLARLSAAGCDLAQGYLIARPAPVEALVAPAAARGRRRSAGVGRRRL